MDLRAKETASETVEHYKDQILKWSQTHDPNLVGILAISRNLVGLSQVQLEDIALVVIKLLNKESVIGQREAKELERIGEMEKEREVLKQILAALRRLSKRSR